MNQANSESGVIAGSHTERPRHKASRAKIVCRNPLLMCKLRTCVYSATDKFASFSTFRPVKNNVKSFGREPLRCGDADAGSGADAQKCFHIGPVVCTERRWVEVQRILS
jgi:hypothetical protein